jgi:N-methylhydantoinase B/oxoprolinase/acetone carboxylase alpha subunit
MYCFRCLIDEDIPLNQGVLAPIEIILPECLLNPPAHADPHQCAAVAGGNVETSQRVVDVVLGALGIAAASQGTMNNLLLGDATFGYYETICGGAGATRNAPGADAVHTHMTNTRLTDPEVLESRYPVRLREFSIRHGSGGGGQHRGGDGVVRQIEFLRPLEVAILSQRRGRFAPYGLDGGEPGAIGANTLFRSDGAAGSTQRTWFSHQLGHVVAIVLALLLMLKITLGLVHALQVEPTIGAGIGAFLGHEFLYLAGLLLSAGACFWFARPRGPVDFNEAHAIDVESMGLYWHFVDIVWIVIFTAVYLLEYL